MCLIVVSYTYIKFLQKKTLKIKRFNGGEKGIRTLGGVSAPHRRSRSAP